MFHYSKKIHYANFKISFTFSAVWRLQCFSAKKNYFIFAVLGSHIARYFFFLLCEKHTTNDNDKPVGSCLKKTHHGWSSFVH